MWSALSPKLEPWMITKEPTTPAEGLIELIEGAAAGTPETISKFTAALCWPLTLTMTVADWLEGNSPPPPAVTAFEGLAEKEICEKLLANTVIESFRYELS